MIIWLGFVSTLRKTLTRALIRQVFRLKTYSKYNDHSDIANNPRVSRPVGHQSYPRSWAKFYDRALQSENVHLVKTHEPTVDDQPAIYIVRDGSALRSFPRPSLRISSTVTASVCESAMALPFASI
jgi:hypothetical protein